MSDFEQMKSSAVENRLDDPAELMMALQKFQEQGYADEPLADFYHVWQRSGGKDPNQFVQEMQQLIPLLEFRGEPAPMPEPEPEGGGVLRAGTPKWPGWGNVVKKL